MNELDLHLLSVIRRSVNFQEEGIIILEFLKVQINVTSLMATKQELTKWRC